VVFARRFAAAAILLAALSVATRFVDFSHSIYSG